MNTLINTTVPGVKEKISWSMPTFYIIKDLIHFAAFKNHIGLYPGSTGVEAFKEKLVNYNTSKGAIQFSFDKPLPLDLIKEIINFKVLENK